MTTHDTSGKESASHYNNDSQALPTAEPSEGLATSFQGKPEEKQPTHEHASSPETPLSKIWHVAKRYSGIGLFIVAFLIAATWAGPRLIFGPQVALEMVIQRDFVQSVVASGRVETPHRVNIGVQITGTVLNVPVSEGQSVTADTVLIELESSELRAAASQALRNVQLASAQLRQLIEVERPLAEHAFEEAQANEVAALNVLTRHQDLFNQDMISQSLLDEVKRAEQVTRSKVSGIRQQMKSTQNNGSKVEIADVGLKQAEAGLLVAQARLAYTTLKAPVSGVLITRNVEPGDVVQPGIILMQLSPAAETQLVVQIEEKNLHLLQLGQSALASADAYSLQHFSAQLVYINPGIDAGRGSIEVKLWVKEPPVYLRQDMTVSVDIEVASRRNAVLVPATAIHDLNSGTPWVLKLDGLQVRRQNLALGLRSNGWSEVLSGLSNGDLVVPISEDSITDGSRVRSLTAVSAIPVVVK